MIWVLEKRLPLCQVVWFDYTQWIPAAGNRYLPSLFYEAGSLGCLLPFAEERFYSPLLVVNGIYHDWEYNGKWRLRGNRITGVEFADKQPASRFDRVSPPQLWTRRVSPSGPKT